MPLSPSARSTTSSCRTSELRRELWNGNSGHGAVPRVPLARLGATALGNLAGSWEVTVHRVLRGNQLIGRDHARHDAPPVGVPSLLEVGRQQPWSHDRKTNWGVCYHWQRSRVFRPAGPVRDRRSSRPLFTRSESLISSFSDLGVPVAYNEVLSRQGITEPLTIQSATIPAALAQRRANICGKAPTGSGKTLAFGIPLVVNTERSMPVRPRALVPAPTRKLASQVHEVLGDLLGHERKRVSRSSAAPATASRSGPCRRASTSWWRARAAWRT